MKQIKIVIVNKYFLMNYAIRCILQRIKGFEVYGVSEDQILSETARIKPDILIVEIDIIKTDSFKLLSSIKSKFSGIKILGLLDIEDKERLSHILEYKLEGLLLKNTSRDELIYAAKCIYKGEKYYSKEIHNYIIEHLTNITEDQKNKANIEVLSEREKEILNLIVQGKNNKDIAKKLFISENTVLTHRRNIMRKVKVKSTAQLIITSLKNGITTVKS
jgi:two-component system, NarL family, response regulator NreC